MRYVRTGYLSRRRRRRAELFGCPTRAVSVLYAAEIGVGKKNRARRKRAAEVISPIRQGPDVRRLIENLPTISKLFFLCSVFLPALRARTRVYRILSYRGPGVSAARQKITKTGKKIK